MATSGGAGAGGRGGGAAAGSTSRSSTTRSPGPDASASAGASIKGGDVEVLGPDGKSQGVFTDGKASASHASFDSARSRSGIRLQSWGDGVASADLDPKSDQVVIRRFGRIVARLDDPLASEEFAARRRFSPGDRELLRGLHALRDLEPEARVAAQRKLAEEAEARQAARINVIAAEDAKGRIPAEAERNDAAVFARVEALRKARQAHPSEPLEPVPPPIAAAGGDAGEASPARAKGRAVPADIARLYPQVGDRFVYPNNTRVVAFVDRGNRLETPSNAPQIARSLVAIAEARDWGELRVKGSDEFRREVWLEASARGIHVVGYRPSQFDQAELERRHALVPRHNALEKRSEILRSMPAEEGVRRDPSLAGAYGVLRHAELVAQRHIHPESRAAFVAATREKIGEQLDAGRQPAATLKIPTGELVEHGPARYNFDPDEKPSYYVKLRDSSGRERIQWGAGLRTAIQSADARPGDTLQLRVTESRGLTIAGNLRDTEGRIVGRKSVDAHRNHWQAVVLARERARERQVTSPRER